MDSTNELTEHVRRGDREESLQFDRWSGDDVGSHFVFVYENTREKLAVITEFLARGLENGENCLAIYEREFVERLEPALHARGIDVPKAIQDGDLTFKTPAETYLAGEETTPDALGHWLAEFADGTGDAVDRISGGMSWAVDTVSESVLSEYERRSDRIIQNSELTVLCPYDRNSFSDEFLFEIVEHHPMYRTPTGSCVNPFQRDGTTPAQPIDEGLFDEVIDTLEDLSRYSSQTQTIAAVTELAEFIDGTGIDDRREFASCVVDAISTIFFPSHTAIWQYDNDSGQFESTPATNSRFEGLEFRTDALSDQAWDVYANSREVETKSLSAATIPETSDDLPIDEGIFVPLGRHGVLVVVFPRYVSLTDSEIAVVHMLQTKIRTALDTISYDRELQRYDARLEDQTERIETLEEIVSLHQGANHELVRSTSRAELEERVCKQLVESPSIEFAWFGTWDPAETELTPTAASETGEGYLEAVAAAGESQNLEPAITACRNGRSTVTEDAYTDPPFEPWRAQALRRGYRSIASVPVEFKDARYGVLTAYSEDPYAFGSYTRRALENLGKCVGHAISARQKKKALITDRVTELTLRIRDESLPIVALADLLDTRISFDGIVPQSEGHPRTYFTVHDCARADVENAAVQSYGISDLSHVVKRGDGHLFASTVDDTCFFGRLLDFGGVPNALEATGTEAEIAVEIPEGTSASSLLSMLEDRFERVEVQSQETRERKFRARDEFKQEFEEQLSDRQKEVLRTAYYSGFFESPRESTGQDLADQLDVSQPTVTENIRSAEREFLTLLFEG
ncbi:bacterio-opsin activator domain-containing protein [Natrarchaeobius chitinivorans]|uniref:GAF domain-containing protein n=1 Tax=Natrarchaeobius chitinivorans TaxID=1679083 RepID=A0A3N6MAS3_NATCH|nr:bacterio-opsin activator domain-containing protein [Natrarchaeobius chitinivorans]RQG97764.1 hypothetical protein EA473_00680 [Natrarchaeobius chitinivorans]